MVLFRIALNVVLIERLLSLSVRFEHLVPAYYSVGLLGSFGLSIRSVRFS